MERTILHCDCNSFYASVECVFRPELKNVPMAVGGNCENRHGIILAKNELAKKYNVQTAETIFSAKRKCPELVIVPPRHKVYEEFSHRINKIYSEYTDLVEKFGIDESWLDVTGSKNLFGSGEEIANTIRRRIREEIGVTISVGVSFNKVFAKLGSDYKKPDAVTVISRENFKDIVYPLPAGDLLFVGKSTAQKLKSIGIKTIGDLACSDYNTLNRLLGKMGATLLCYARGEDNSEVDPHSHETVKSIGNSITFRRDLVSEEDIICAIGYLSESIASRMRKKRVRCSVVQIMIKDTALRCITRQEKLSSPTNLAKDISSKAIQIIHNSWNIHNPIRMLSVTGMGLVSDDEEFQLSFFDSATTNKKREKLENALDSIREKYGNSSVKSANIINNDLGLD